MWSEEKITLPVTLVNEYNSSQQAKAKIAEMVQTTIQQTQRTLITGSGEDQLIARSIDNALTGQQVHSIQNSIERQLDPEVMLRKGIYDKVAAQIILQEFIDIYNKQDEREQEEEKVKII